MSEQNFPGEKYIKDGKVAVLISTGPGAGWSTWNDVDPSDGRYARLIESKEYGKAAELAESEGHFPIGLSDAVIIWVKIGSRYKINEYDGHESIVIDDDDVWRIA